MESKRKLIKTVSLCAAFSFLCIFMIPAIAQSQDQNKQKKVNVTKKQELKDNVEKKSAETQDSESEALIQDALKAYNETITAAEALDKGDKKGAMDALESSIGKLDIVLSQRPDLSLIPIESRVETIDIVSDLPTIEDKRAEAEFLVEKGHLQDARRLLDTLVSEIRITTANLPMETYPVAIRGIARLIEENKIDDAKLALQQVLSTVVVVERSIPIPIINCELLLTEAQKIVQKEKSEKISKENKDKVLGILDQAKVELESAEALGYGRKNVEFEGIRNDIKEIGNKIKQSEKTGNLFDNLKERLKKFKDKIS